MPQEHEKPTRTPERIQHGKVLSEILQNQFRLSAPEAEAYISLLLMGQLTPSEISYYSGLSQEKVDTALKSLSEKRLVRIAGGIVNRYFALAPYKIFANSIQDFQTKIATLQKSLLANQEKATTGIETRLEQIAARIIQDMKDWRTAQNTTLVDTCSSASNMLETAAQELHGLLTQFSDTSSDKLSMKTQQALQIFQKTIIKGMKQLQDTLTKNLSTGHQEISKQGKTSEECLTTASARLLKYLDTVSTNLKEQFRISKASIVNVTETSTSDIRSNFTSTQKQMQKEVQQVVTEVTEMIEGFEEQQTKTISDWQKQQTRIISAITKRVNQQIRESGRQRLELLDQLVSKIGEAHREEHEQLIQFSKQTTTEIDSSINKSRQESIEIGDLLSKSLQKAITEYSQSLKQLKAENTITQFSPETLTTTHLTKIKESLTKLTQQASEEYEKLLDSVNETLGARVSRAYLDQLAALRTLLEELQQDLSKQQSALTENIESIANQVTTETSTQITNLHQTTQTTIQTFEEMAKILKKQEHEIKQQLTTILTQQLASVAQELDVTRNRLSQLARDTLGQTQQQIETLSSTSTTHITEYNTSFQKQIDTLEAHVVKETNQTTLELQQDFDQIQEAIDQQITGIAVAEKSKLNTILTQKSQSLRNRLASFRSEIGKMLTIASKNLLQETTDMKERINQEINTVSKGSISQLAALRTLLEELQQDLSKQQSALTENIESIANQVTTETSTQITNLHQTTQTTIQNLQKGVAHQERLIRDLEHQMQAILQNQISSVTKELGIASTQIREFIQDKVRQTEKTVEQLGATSTAKITEYRNAFEIQMRAFETDVNTESDKCMSSLQRELAQFIKTVNKIVNTTETAAEQLQLELDSQASKFTPAYRTQVNQHHNIFREYLLNEIQKIITRFSEVENTLLPHITRIGQETRQSLEDSLTYTTNSIEESKGKIRSESEKLVIECKAAMKSTIDNVRINFSEKLATMKDSLIRVHNQTLQKAIDILTAFQSETTKALANAERSFDSEISSSRGTIEQELVQSTQEFAKGVENIIEVLKGNSEEALKITNETLRAAYETSGSEIQQHLSEIISIITQLSNSTKENLQTQTQKIKDNMESRIEEKRRSLETETQTSSQTITTAIAESKELVTSILNKYTKNVVPLTQSIQAKSETAHTMLSNLWELLGTIQVSEIERTWRIVSSEKVKIRLKDMLERAKSTITLVFPNYDEIPQKILMKISPDVRIHLITKIDEKHTQHAQKLLEKGNIRIWHTIHMPFYAGARDSEEVLIAPVHGDPQEIVAVVSDQESYISLFNKALGPRWISSAKEIRRN